MEGPEESPIVWSPTAVSISGGPFCGCPHDNKGFHYLRSMLEPLILASSHTPSIAIVADTSKMYLKMILVIV